MNLRNTFFFCILLVQISCIHKPLVTPSPQKPDDCNGLVPSFQKDIQPILKLNCAKSGCHDGENMPHDFSQYNELLPVLSDSSLYYYVVIDRTMPQDTALGSNEYRLIKCWLNNGFPNN